MILLLVRSHEWTLRVRKRSTVLLFGGLRSLNNVLRSMLKDIEIGLCVEELLEFHRMDVRRRLVI